MTTNRFFRTEVYAYALFAMLAACGGKKDKSSAPPAPVDTEITGTEEGPNGTRVKFKSNTAGAKFMCKTEIDGQTGEWQSCESDGFTVNAIPGARVVVKVKAIGPDGREDADPASRTFGEAASSGAVAILNKADVGSVYQRSSLRLNFGTPNSRADVSSIQWQCKRENESDFKACPGRDSYDFGELIDGSTYSLTMRGMDRQNRPIGEDSVTFRVQIAKVKVTGEEQLRTATTGSVSLRFDEATRSNQRIMASINGKTPEDWTAGKTLPLDTFESGSHMLRIDAIDQTGNAVASSQIPFCVRQCSGAAGSSTADQPVVSTFQIGSFYAYTIPDDMHVTEYATTKTYNNSLSFYRIMTGNGPNQDPYYLGNYACNAPWDRVISAPAPNGKLYDYCHSTPTRDWYKIMTDSRIANNHLELGPNPATLNPINGDRIAINVFDRDYEFMYPRSRFDQLCMNKRGAIQRTLLPIAFTYNDFFGRGARANFFMCVAELAGPSTGLPGLPGAADEWWIGSFFLTSEGLELPMYECYNNNYTVDAANPNYNKDHYPANYQPQFCGTFKNPNLLEVVVMTKKPFREAADFAKYSQSLFMKNLTEISPVAL